MQRNITAGRLRDLLPTAVVVIVILLLWEFFGAITGEPKYILPPLSDVARVITAHSADELLPAVLVTSREVLLGFFFGGLTGLTLGTSIFLSKTVRRAIMPLVITTQAVPVLAIAPILVIWFGFTITPKVIVAALVVFFPVVITTIAGLNAADPDMVTLMRSLGGSAWQIFWQVRIQAALPIIFAGLKNAAAVSAIGAIVGEWVGSSAGLGPVMIASTAGFKTATTFAAIIYLASIAVLLFGVVSLSERVALPWYFIERKATGSK